MDFSTCTSVYGCCDLVFTNIKDCLLLECAFNCIGVCISVWLIVIQWRSRPTSSRGNGRHSFTEHYVNQPAYRLQWFGQVRQREDNYQGALTRSRKFSEKTCSRFWIKTRSLTAIMLKIEICNYHIWTSLEKLKKTAYSSYDKNVITMHPILKRSPLHCKLATSNVNWQLAM